MNYITYIYHMIFPLKGALRGRLEDDHRLSGPRTHVCFVPCHKPHWEARRRRVWAGL